MKSGFSGFSLIELMVTIAIAAILSALAAPSYRALIIDNSISTQASDLAGVLAFARSEAAKRGMTVRVTASGTDFSSGWSVWVDENNDNAISTGETLKMHEALKTGYTLVGEGFANTAEIQYRSNGSADSSGSFTLCFSGYTGRLISVSATGRVSSTKTSSVCS